MDLKVPTWSLVLVILDCSFTAGSTTLLRSKKLSPSSSSTSWSSSPIYLTKFTGGSQQRPNTIYTRTFNFSNTNQQSKWSSKTVMTHTSHGMKMRQSSRDMIMQTPSKSNIQNYQHVQPTQYYQIIPSHVLLSLQIADRFRYNAIFILGFLLASPNSRLTLQQYTSLKIIYNALQRRQVQMYRLLPALAQIRDPSKRMQLLTLMDELTKYLPQYCSCSARFWAFQIRNNVFIADTVLINGHEEFNLFNGITESDIEIIQRLKVDDEMSGYDESSKRTETLLGRIFVKIFKSITVNKLSLTQQLFAIILQNLPNLDGDVVFEEYVQFIAEAAWRNRIPNWKENQIYQNSIEIYTLIETITQRITSDMSVSQVIKQALIYIKNHFLDQRNYVMVAHESYQITEDGGLDITYLLSIISDGDNSIIQWKNQLLEFSRSHTVVMETVLEGMNKYGYISRQKLLLAFLTRLTTRLPVEHIEIRQIVYGLLTIVEQKIPGWHTTQITPVPAGPGTTTHLTTAKPISTILGKKNSPDIWPNAARPNKTHSPDIRPTVTEPGKTHSPNIEPNTATPGETHSTNIESTAVTSVKTHLPDIGPNSSANSKTHVPHVGLTGITPGKTKSPDIGLTVTKPGKTKSPDIGLTVTKPGKTKSPDIGLTATKPGKTYSSDIGPTSPTPVKTHSTNIGPTSPSPSNTYPPDIGLTATKPSKTYSRDTGPTTPTPVKTHATNIGPTSPSPSKTYPPDIEPTAAKSVESHSPDIETTAASPDIETTAASPDIESTAATSVKTHSPTIEPTPPVPSKTHLSDIGPTATKPGKKHSPNIGPTATPVKTHLPDIESTVTTPGKTRSPDIGPTATTPGITYSTVSENNTTEKVTLTTTSDSNLNPINLDNTISHSDVIPYPPEEEPGLSLDINPNERMSIEVTENDIPIFSSIVDSNNSKNVLTVPSMICLQQSPNAENSKGKCATNTEDYITTHLIKILGKDYVQKVLGYKWTVHYTTKISFLLALLENAQKNPVISSQTELTTIINRYKIALKAVAMYVFLPLIIQQQNIGTKIIWSTFDVTNPSKSYIESHRPEQIGTNMITLPLVNPKVWFHPVDLNNPFANLLPDLPADNPDVLELHHLYQIFTSNEIVTLLGKDWNPSVYPNRGALFISVLRTLLTRETVKTNTALYKLIQNYLRAIELPAIYTHIPTSYLTRVVHVDKFVVIIPRFPTAISEIKVMIPETVNPQTKIQLVISELGIPSIESLTTVDDTLTLKNLVSLPSVTCLLQAPSAGNSPDECETDVDVHVTETLIKNFGINYIDVILGDDAKALYPTRVSLLVDLLEKVQTNPKIANQFESIQIIRRYTTAVKSVASYVFLPLTVSYRMMNTVVVWLSYDINNPSQIDIKPLPPHTISNNIITLPLINPKTWVLSVDIMEPFSGFIPKFSDAASSFAIQIEPLAELIQTGRIYKLLGSDWKTSQFPNRGALYISVIYTLLTVQEVKTNIQLYTLLQHFLTAIEMSSIYVRISNNYLETVIHRWQIDQQQIINRFDSIVANVTARDDILLPALINPNRDLEVIMKTFGRIFVQTTSFLKTEDTDSIILPSVNCLQAYPLDEHDTYCEHIPNLPILHSLIKKLGTKDTDELLEKNDNDGYPTVAAYLDNFLKKAIENKKVAEESQLVADIKKYITALEFASSYIFLPLLTNYQEINDELVWVTYDTTDHHQSHLSRHRDDNEENDNIISLPLVNPKVWLQSVNIEHPFSSFIPTLPANDPYANKLQPLVQLFNSGEIRLLLGWNFSPANYPNRGSLLISGLRLLLKSKTVQSNRPLHKLVESYFNVIQIVSMYVHIPRSWINNGFTKAEYSWNVDTADLSTVLPFPQTVEERQYFGLIQAFLQRQDIIQIFDIQLPSSSTYKAEFLIMIIKRVLASSGLVQISRELQAALEYYSAKPALALTVNGGIVHWVWVRQTSSVIRSMKTLRLDLGKIFTTTIPLSRLKSNKAKIHYFKLIEFMNDNFNLLKTDRFQFERYHNFGHFLRAYLNHLRHTANIDNNVKTYIGTVVGYVRNTGPGAQLIRPKI